MGNRSLKAGRVVLRLLALAAAAVLALAPAAGWAQGGGSAPADPPPPLPSTKGLPAEPPTPPPAVCSQAERDNMVENLTDQLAQVQAIITSLQAYIDARETHAAQDENKGDKKSAEAQTQALSEATALLNKAEWAEDDLKKAIVKAKAARVVDCKGGKGVIPPTPPLTVINYAAPPKHFCSQAEKDATLKALKALLVSAADNVAAAAAHLADLERMDELASKDPRFALYKEKIHAAVKSYSGVVEEQRAAMNALTADIIAVAHAQVVDCSESPGGLRTPGGETGGGKTRDGPKPDGGTPTGGGSPTSPGGKRPRKPCSPTHRPATVGPNGKVGSGARGKQKAAGVAMGVVGGLLGGGGGGGGSDGPQTVNCHIKDKDLTVFDDPASGVSLGVSAREGKGGQTTVFAKVVKSPDSGTFQAGLLERPDGGAQAPRDISVCDLWGEWQLTVSWTKTTYVNGQQVSRESGGWSKSGSFSLPGFASGGDKPDGLWRRLGFSNASHGAREIAMTYQLSPEDFADGPVDMVIHISRPGGDPVTTVPFVLEMTRGPAGLVFTREGPDACDEEKVGALDRGRLHGLFAPAD